MAEYFLGRRDIASFTIELDRGNAVLQCDVAEYWSPIIHDSSKCGAELTYELSKKTGVKESEKVAFEDSLEASIGLKSIAQIKAIAKQNLTTEVHWESVQEEKRKVVFPSPECGKYTALQYQKLRDYHFTFQEKKWFHKNSWQSYFTEHTKFYHDDSKTIDPDPNCNCKPKEPSDFDGLLHVDFGDTSMIAPFRKSSTGIEIELSGKKANIEATGDSSFIVNIPIEYVPDSLKFLGDMKEESYEATATPYSEPVITHELAHSYEVEAVEMTIQPLSSSEGKMEVES
ncbi:hypothetical protein [Aeromonas bivalvium]|uniref:hypothetical protein n=1 Tax=Aeromonas bivalvium TaxID=440079 RepID=UPI0038D23CBF